MNIDVDSWSTIFLQTNLSEPYFLVSKMLHQAFKNAVKIKVGSINPIKVFVFRKRVFMKLEYHNPQGWGLYIKTRKQIRFFPKKNVQENNLWVESPLIISVKKKVISVQYMYESILYIQDWSLPHDFRFMLF